MSDDEGAAWKLVGLTLEGGWYVDELIDPPDDHTGSAFSVGYYVHDGTGKTAFLKALDFQSALQEDDPVAALQQLTAAFSAERQIVELCGNHGLNRIVRGLSAGNIRVPGSKPEAVSYLIFERADRDSRSAVTNADPANQLPMVRLAHNAAAALNQLHGLGATHQDVKPSNLFVWDEIEGPAGKLGDLGSAHLNDRPAPHDNLVIAGDMTYAAPEQLYGCPMRLANPLRRKASDMYMFGSLLTYLLVGVSFNGLLYRNLDRSLHWTEWEGTFDEAMPALMEAHERALEQLAPALQTRVADDMTQIVRELCEPDSDFRGDSKARRRSQNPFQLDRYITRLDLIYRRAQIELKIA